MRPIAQASRNTVLRSRCVRQAANAVTHTITSTIAGDVAVERVRLVQPANLLVHAGLDRDQRAVHQRPVREHETGVLRGHVGAEQEQHEHRGGGQDREQREPLGAAARRQPRRVEGPHRDVDQQAQERHRRGQVGGHGLARVVHADGLAAEPGLEDHERDGGERRPQDRRAVPVVLPGEERDAQDQEADDRRDRAVDPLPPGLVVVQRRDDLAVAQGPVGAAHPGIRGAHDDAHGDEEDRRDDRCDGGLLEAGHGWCDRPRGCAGQGRSEPGENAGRHSTRGSRDPDPGVLGLARPRRPGASRARPRRSGYAPCMRRPSPRSAAPTLVVLLALVAVAAAACGGGGTAQPGWSTAPASSAAPGAAASGPAASAGRRARRSSR